MEWLKILRLNETNGVRGSENRKNPIGSVALRDDPSNVKNSDLVGVFESMRIEKIPMEALPLEMTPTMRELGYSRGFESTRIEKIRLEVAPSEITPAMHEFKFS
ncbi:hypothetical protein HAX54_046976 [Datura stramonium]|uniref:Uncharacterized protein n=1 Tax=Datura stramonium TaxID=4076 RepID=A0ABS8RQJ2_DATST|nr:hypothetical protein [Datura stramonium]